MTVAEIVRELDELADCLRFTPVEKNFSDADGCVVLHPDEASEIAHRLERIAGALHDQEIDRQVEVYRRRERREAS